MSYTHEFHEAGNGFPDVGDDVILDKDGDIALLTVTAIGPIHTAQWQANMVYLTCEPAADDWDAYSESQQDRMYDNYYHVGAIDETAETE